MDTINEGYDEPPIKIEPKEEFVYEEIENYDLSEAENPPGDDVKTKACSNDTELLGLHSREVESDYFGEPAGVEVIVKEELDLSCSEDEDDENPLHDDTAIRKEPSCLPDDPDKDNKSLECHICNKKYSLRNSYLCHMKKHGLHQTTRKHGTIASTSEPVYDEKKNFCISCNIKFQSKRTFNLHKMAHRYMVHKHERGYEDTQFDCEFCNSQLNSFNRYRSHLVMAHGDEIPKIFQNDPAYLRCLYCHLQFEKPTTRFEHERTHKSEEKPFLCSTCSRAFSRRRDRKLHETLHCPKSAQNANRVKHKPVVFSLDPEYDNDKNFCITCDRQFDSRAAFTSHRKVHTEKIRLHRDQKPKGDEMYNCELCSRKLTSAYRFRIHVATMHGDIIPKSQIGNPAYLRCLFCHLEFEKPTLRFQHEQTHMAEDKPYRCPVCPRAFKRLGAREYHQEVHSQGPITCDQCPVVCQTRSQLNMHIQNTHNKPIVTEFPCKRCGKVFDSYVKRKSHALSHRDEFQFECDVCKAKFSLEKNLVLHKKKHLCPRLTQRLRRAAKKASRQKQIEGV
ncbi:unnamed protein product [Hermetia illucens]|uniref:C2H2-type domain-containing protein n=1 Tax=Hermetia illucens TaxID=343691 RepID=A0A7R8UGM9_HERIL|nr:zinc finger protein 709-like [Hermetia illucens]CAD7080456.1 unnamed protein product [Hermetia illucens]